jgi:hypothetical protein
MRSFLFLSHSSRYLSVRGLLLEALGSAILLRRAAEQLRETALNDLRRFRLMGHEVDVKREAFDELIAEIRHLKTGAFAPLTDQPFIRAVLFPGAVQVSSRSASACSTFSRATRPKNFLATRFARNVSMTTR